MNEGLFKEKAPEMHTLSLLHASLACPPHHQKSVCILVPSPSLSCLVVPAPAPAILSSNPLSRQSLFLCNIPARSLLHWLFSSFKCRLSSASLPLTPATSRRLWCNLAMVRSLALAALANSSPRRTAFCWLEAASSCASRSCSFRGSSSASEEKMKWRLGLSVSHHEPGRRLDFPQPRHIRTQGC